MAEADDGGVEVGQEADGAAVLGGVGGEEAGRLPQAGPAVTFGPTEADEVVRERRRRAPAALDELVDGDNGLMPLEQHVALTWLELEARAGSPDGEPPAPSAADPPG